jgi:hypothetical protein
MAKDVFVSYSTPDRTVADKLCMVFEELCIDCWIAPRDIPPGAEFDVAILNGIDQCRAMVVVLTGDANSSPYVKNEVNRAFSHGKPILTFRVEDIKPAKALEFYLARHQWTDGFPPPVEERIARMARALLELLGRGNQIPGSLPRKSPETSDDVRVADAPVNAAAEPTGTSSLARGSEEFAVRFKFRERDDAGKYLRDVWLTRSVTWDDIFARLGPFMFGEGASVIGLQNAMRDYLRFLEEHEEIWEDEDSVNTIIVQLHALGLIKRTRNQKYWTLTPDGEKHLAKIKAIRSQGR